VMRVRHPSEVRNPSALVMDPVALLQEPQDAILLETTQDLGRASTKL